MPIVRERRDNVTLGCVLSNSFGFGGTNASVVFKRPDAFVLPVIPGREAELREPGIHSPARRILPQHWAYGFRLSLRSAGMTK